MGEWERGAPFLGMDVEEEEEKKKKKVDVDVGGGHVGGMGRGRVDWLAL